MAIKKVTVLYGGESSERSVSLESGKYVFQSVKNLGYEAELIDYPSEFHLKNYREKILFLLHSTERMESQANCKSFYNKITFNTPEVAKKLVKILGIKIPLKKS